MNLLKLCAVLSFLLAISFASPVKRQIQDVSDSSGSSEEINKINNINNIAKDENEENKPLELTQVKRETVVKDQSSEESSSEEDKRDSKDNYVIMVVDDNEIFDNNKETDRSKRSFAIDNTYLSNNHLTVKDEGSIKYEKYLKLKRLRRDLTSDESRDSSEEQKISQKQAENQNNNDPGQGNAEASVAVVAEGIAVAEKSDTVPTENEAKPEEELVKGEVNIRRRSLDDLSEEDQSEQEKQDANEVFVFSNENYQNSEEDNKINNLKHVVLNDNYLQRIPLEKKSSNEDYAQGCGGSNSSQEGQSNETSNESNESNEKL